ncbi:hypothetical protein [Actinomycetospora termitidis]|uniref:Serine/threonine protein kinase n=1 Tax=Actinomycetospora termitidis TaxID=3053470 RepID=A0ABT7MGB1_9PSEU|nr:hypothetical protein [Actinomycetospora sp. Odt1-22]MDL5158982.1 hypothetical protein [Actinomycetospora sp. Odt1-22]
MPEGRSRDGESSKPGDDDRERRGSRRDDLELRQTQVDTQRANLPMVIRHEYSSNGRTRTTSFVRARYLVLMLLLVVVLVLIIGILIGLLSGGRGQITAAPPTTTTASPSTSPTGSPPTPTTSPGTTSAPAPSIAYEPVDLRVARGDCSSSSTVDMDIPQTGPSLPDYDFGFSNCARPRPGVIEVNGGNDNVAFTQVNPPTPEACDEALRLRAEASGPSFLPEVGQVICFTNTSSGLSSSGKQQQINALVVKEVADGFFIGTAFGWHTG